MINCSNTVSFGVFNYSGTSFTYTASGSISITGVSAFATTCTINSNGLTWGAVSFSGASQTYTLGTDMIVSGLLTLGASGSPIMNGNTLKIGGGVTHSTSGTWSGTTAFLINGTGTWSSSSAACVIQNNVTINLAGTLTIGTIVAWNGGTLTYTAGTIAGTGTLTINSSSTLNTSGMTWPNVSFTNTETITLNSLLTISGTLTTGALSVTFAGTAGWTTGTFSMTTGDDVLKSGNTYTVTSNFTAVGLASNNASLTSSIGASQATFTLNQGATQDVGFCSATDITSASGQTIWPYKPTTLSNATNWRTLPVQPPTITSSN